MAETEPKPKPRTLSDDDISISRPKVAPNSVGRIGTAPDVVGGGKGASDPDASPPKMPPTDPDA